MKKTNNKPMPVNIGDYIANTTMLSCKEHGAYFLILCAMWKNGGSLPFDYKEISSMSGIKIEELEETWDGIRAFFVVESGKLKRI